MLRTISGKIQDSSGKTMSDLFVEAYHTHFGGFDDYIGNAITDSQGEFEIKFDDKQFESHFKLFKFLQGSPHVYVVVRNAYQMIYKSEIRKMPTDTEPFDITISETRPSDDPYAHSFQREISYFSSIGDTVDTSLADPRMLTQQMIRSLSSWLYYTNPKIMQIYGYAGPQVPSHPKDTPHYHSLPWNKKDGPLVP